MNFELKPCPFCGGMNLYYAAGRYSAVECSDCGAKVVGAFRTEEEAAEAWNRRVQLTFTSATMADSDRLRQQQPQGQIPQWWR